MYKFTSHTFTARHTYRNRQINSKLKHSVFRLQQIIVREQHSATGSEKAVLPAVSRGWRGVHDKPRPLRTSVRHADGPEAKHDVRIHRMGQQEERACCAKPTIILVFF